MTVHAKLNEQALILQGKFAFIDMISKQQITCGTEFLVMRLLDLKIKMYQERHHKLPHLHIDYGRKHHTASYSIREAARLEGDLSKKYDKIVSEWIEQNNQILLELWDATQAGNEVKTIIAQLRGND